MPQGNVDHSGTEREFVMTPGAWRSGEEHDVAVAAMFRPSAARVEDFMQYFENGNDFKSLKQAGRIMAMAAPSTVSTTSIRFPTETDASAV